MIAELVVDVTGDLEVTEDGSLSVLTEMEPLGELTIATHGQGELVSGSVKVLSDGPIGGGVRYGVPEIGVAGVGASPPVRDVLFPARQPGGRNPHGGSAAQPGRGSGGGELPIDERGRLRSKRRRFLWRPTGGLPGSSIRCVPRTTDTSDFAGSVRCTVLGSRRFTAIGRGDG